jgi:hypothetical protein
VKYATEGGLSAHRKIASFKEKLQLEKDMGKASSTLVFDVAGEVDKCEDENR